MVFEDHGVVSEGEGCSGALQGYGCLVSLLALLHHARRYCPPYLNARHSDVPGPGYRGPRCPIGGVYCPEAREPRDPPVLYGVCRRVAAVPRRHRYSYSRHIPALP